MASMFGMPVFPSLEYTSYAYSDQEVSKYLHRVNPETIIDWIYPITSEKPGYNTYLLLVE